MGMEAVLSPTFVIGSIHIDTVQNASSITIGNNWLYGFQNVSKSTQGIGTLYGDKNIIHSVKTMVYDSDLPSEKSAFSQGLPDWLTGWMTNRENELSSSSPHLS